MAFRSEAVDFLEKPIDHARLLAAIDEAFARQHRRQDDQERNAATATLLDTLTPRKREVMAHRWLPAGTTARSPTYWI